MTRKAERNNAMLAAEPKDPAWAYPMEQKLREFTSRRFQSSEINVVAVDCRKTFCRLQASGRTSESQSAFRKAAEDASKESWANLWYAGVAGHAENGVWDGSVVLYRRNSQ